MRHLFSRTSDGTLAGLMQRKPLLAFDFDGTLAPLVERPSMARLEPAHGRQADTTGGAPCPLSSSPAARCATSRRASKGFRWRASPATTASSPGAPHPRSSSWSPAGRTMLSQRFGQVPGLEIENKRWSLTVDYRHVPDLSGTEKALAAFARTLPQVRVLGGRHADLNLAPAGEHHKGTALARHVAALGRDAALYVGDDRTDEDAFAQPIAGLVSVRVGQKAGSHARFFLQEQTEVDRLLDALLALARRRRPMTAPATPHGDDARPCSRPPASGGTGCRRSSASRCSPSRSSCSAANCARCRRASWPRRCAPCRRRRWRWPRC